MSNAVVPAAPVHHELVAQMVREIHAIVTVEDDTNTNDFVIEIMGRILGAETIEDMFSAQEAGLISSKEYLDRPFTLHEDGIQWRKSDPDYVGKTGFPFYAMLTVTDMEDGETKTISAGGLSTVAVLRKMQVMGYLSEPRLFRFAGREAGAGIVVLLKPVKPVTVPGAQKNGKK